MAALDNPLNRQGLCVLSLDGGGVRGLSSLLILKALMAKVNAERRKDGMPPVKPCKLFDLIGGTSTGGIIAIMLGRLEMDVEECINAYTSMFGTIFKKKNLPINFLGKIKGRFKSSVLEACIIDILRGLGLSENEALNDGKERCKVAVCATAFETKKTTLIRSYQSADVLNNIPATISEAARATSAATSFFDSVEIGPRKRRFVDGGLGANNPAEYLWIESQEVWCPDKNIELQRLLKCFVSIGTGDPGVRPVDEGALKFFSDTLVGIATQSEETAMNFVQKHRGLYENKRYFRFNVQQGLQGVGLEEYKKEAMIDAATARYMDNQEIRSAADVCAANLKQKHFTFNFSAKDIIDWEDSATYNSKQEPIILTPFDRNDGYVNRENIFEKLDHLLAPSSLNRSVAIWGLGGSGKTQIALQYAYRCLDQKILRSIYWIHSDSEARFTQDYTKLASKAKLSSDLKGQDLLHAVREWMEKQTDWLLVIDNADDLEIFKSTYSTSQASHLQNPNLLQYLPKAPTGSIIWTSRDAAILGNIIDINRGVEVGPMSGHEALELFQELSGKTRTISPPQEERELLDLLQRLPLAISQAAAFIRKTKISVGRYLKLFTESDSQQSALLSHEFPDVHRSDVPNSVMRTWQISMEQIAKENPIGEQILNTLAFLDTKGIPFDLLKSIASLDLDEDDKKKKQDDKEEEEEVKEDEGKALLAASRLVEFSFLQYQKSDDELPTYEQHRLVQLATQWTLSNRNKVKLFSGHALKIMVNTFPDGSFETWKDCVKYLPHALKAISSLEANKYKTRAPILLACIGRYYWEQGRSNEAEQLYVEVLELRKEVLGPKHPAIITAMANLASTWQQQGRSNKAEQLYVEVLELQKEVLGPKHPATITAMANLASTWQQQGRPNEAEQLYVEVLELRKEVLGPKHPDTITAMANLASTWQQQGRSNEAEQLYVEVLELQKEILGSKHPGTITAMANLASTWQQQGRSNEAEQLYVEVLELQKEILGSKHPGTITAMANLASTWQQQGRSNEAEQFEVEVLELRKEVLGPKHPDTITAMANLASTWWQQGRSNEAEQFEVEVLELRKEVLGPKHPDTITAMANLASTWQQQGRSNEAEQLYVEVLELRKEVLGPKHPATITAMANLASTWWQQGRSNEAEQLLVEALELQKEVVGTDHPTTLEFIKNLSIMNEKSENSLASGVKLT
ncbi:MAG: hypothetical protein M1829_001664 [Trizodia sp. TS-e1964]|nr:MAG: hypothetical protein M1829_001664 [Trizodia sp. TS-e1964]